MINVLSLLRRRLVVPGLVLVGLPLVLTAAPEALNYQTQQMEFKSIQPSVQIPEGYMLELLNSRLEKPRMLTFAANGDLFIGSHSGHVYRLTQPYTSAQSLVQLNDYPHSVALREGEILIAQTGGLYRAPYQPGQAQIDRQSLELLAELPSGGAHSSRTVRTGPDGRIYVSLGINSNCSDQYLGTGYDFTDQRGGVMVLDEQSNPPRWQPYATGLRNPIGFDWQPQTGVMYSSNNGPDHWGYELPLEAFSKLTPGSFHGMPWYQVIDGKLQRDDCVDSDPPRPHSEVSLPVATFPARKAPMAVAFVPEGTLANLAGDAVVALHGSWATKPDGGGSGDPATRREPKLVVVRFQDGEAVQVDDLITGFQLDDGRRWLRPTGVAIGPDGALYFASDSGTQGLFRLSSKD
jgi:glucose/arabinose dehydrogenase